MKNFNFFGASDARWVNSQRLHHRESVASVLSVLRQFYKKQTIWNLYFSIYETSIICTLFSLNQHNSVFAEGIRLLAYKHRVLRF